MYHESLQITTDGITLRGGGSDDASAVLEPPALPPNNACTAASGGQMNGVCVRGQLTPDFQVIKPVAGVSISRLRIPGFPATGIIGFGTDKLSVTHVTALNDGGYGIARFLSTSSRMVDNRTAGNEEAGLYVGDSPNADTVVSGNRTLEQRLRHLHPPRAQVPGD